MRNIQTIFKPSIPRPAIWSRPELNLLRPRQETEHLKQMSCDVVFGSPSADCMGTGVCRISARTGRIQDAGIRKRSCKSTVGLFFPREGGQGVSMVLTRAQLCTQLYKTHLRHGSLTLKSPCPLPKMFISTLGLKFRELSVGEYSIQEFEGFLRIDF